MDKYKIYCTEEQTEKALELGAPIEVDFQFNSKTAIINKKAYVLPRAEEIIGWLEEQESFSNICVRKTMGGNHSSACYCNGETLLNKVFSSRKDATLAAIDVALEYLINNKERI